MKRVSRLATNSLVHIFVRRAILEMVKRNISKEDRQVIHADLIPRFSEEIVQKHLEQGPETYKKIEAKRPVFDSANPVPLKPLQSINNSVASPLPTPPASLIEQQRPQKDSIRPLQIPPFLGGNKLVGTYGKLTPLIQDPSVGIIECSGANNPITVTRLGGQRQTTKITLTAQEISEILQTISEESHVPLLEGVFRVMVGNMVINAVISELIGSKFVIRKNVSL